MRITTHINIIETHVGQPRSVALLSVVANLRRPPPPSGTPHNNITFIRRPVPIMSGNKTSTAAAAAAITAAPAVVVAVTGGGGDEADALAAAATEATKGVEHYLAGILHQFFSDVNSQLSSLKSSLVSLKQDMQEIKSLLRENDSLLRELLMDASQATLQRLSQRTSLPPAPVTPHILGNRRQQATSGVIRHAPRAMPRYSSLSHLWSDWEKRFLEKEKIGPDWRKDYSASEQMHFSRVRRIYAGMKEFCNRNADTTLDANFAILNAKFMEYRCAPHVMVQWLQKEGLLNKQKTRGCNAKKQH